MWLSRSVAAVAVTGLLIGVPVVDLAQAAPPHPVSGREREVPLAGADAVSAARAGAPAPPGTTTRQVRVGAGALIGVTLPEGTPTSSVQVRVQDDDGEWQAWTSLAVEGAPDPGTVEAEHAAVASDPLWIGEGDADRQVQVRLPRADAAEAALAVVDPGTSRADRAVSAAGPAASASAATTAPAVHPRADWGADESLRSCPPQYADTVKAVVVHHTAGTNDYTQADVPGILRGIYRYHTQTQGWCDIGYNALVDRFGGLWEGRAGGLDRAVIGAHAGGFNTATFGISMMGTHTDAAPSAATWESVAQLAAWRLAAYDRDPQGTTVLTSAGGGTSRYPAGTPVTLPVVLGHRDVGYTECPGTAAYAELPALRARVAQLVAPSSAAASPADPGAVQDAWLASGGASGPLGQPVGVESPTADGTGRYARFTGGAVYWSAATGAHTVTGASYDAWASRGGERSSLGYPTTDTAARGAGTSQHFTGGSIYWSPATRMHPVRLFVLP